MKNPFEKNDHKLLIGGIVLGSIAAGAVAYLFLTETGSQVRKELAGHFNRMLDTFLGNTPEEQVPESEPAYLRHRGKAPKTDREELKKHATPHDHGSQDSHHESEQS